MMRPDARFEKVYLYAKPVDFRKSIDVLAALAEWAIIEIRKGAREVVEAVGRLTVDLG